MALIKCPECGNEFSSFADRCPKCGYPTAKIAGIGENEAKEGKEIVSSSNRSSQKMIVSIIVGCTVVLIAAILWFVFAKSDDAAGSSANIISKTIDKVVPPLRTPDLQLAQVHGNVKMVKTKSYVSDSNFKSKQLNEEVHNSGGKNWETYSFDTNGYFAQYKDFHLTCSKKGDIGSVKMDAYVDIDPQHMGVYDWKSIDATLKRDVKGYIVSEKYVIDGNEEGTNYTNIVADGKIKTREYKTFGPADTFSGAVSYDSNGNAIKRVDNEENAIITSTYEYTKFDKHNNWTQRKVTVDVDSDFAGDESGRKFYIEERTIEYY